MNGHNNIGISQRPRKATEHFGAAQHNGGFWTRVGGDCEKREVSCGTLTYTAENARRLASFLVKAADFAE